MDSSHVKAFIFDLNGTMIKDMDYHIHAWTEILNGKLGLRLSREQVKQEMYGKNEELLVRVFGPNHFSPEEMREISLEKEQLYQQAFRPHLKLINGLENFLKTAYTTSIRMAIGSAAVRMNVDFVLDGLHIRNYFDAIVCADDVAQSKPDPETFLKAAQALQCAPQDCLVFEDAPKGVEAARNAGMQTVVLTTMHTKKEFAAYANIERFAADYTDPALLSLFQKAVAS